jgi:hypothetical protein
MLGITAASIGPENMVCQRFVAVGASRAIHDELPDQHLGHEDGGECCTPNQYKDASGIAHSRSSLLREAGKCEDARYHQDDADEEEEVGCVPA